ncbi:arginine--tRNA ligase [Candidatus Campbellbacteria bacterium RIFCSPLOWO2_02_FULL_35_11]|uniref:Arginine--tRNA ligase n=1 Tax=Candidatus Campbellbacteria bacterium RIFCSPLOWO2_02_FULL_35_11 TaxID=1797581 RepID=A0A1F5ET92_9BACT|nr:MAG: arginine--tRNA ligase [Candidatus Campbellbacteria bacterium RIFCSPLOWO2_02_FULL_35_11]
MIKNELEKIIKSAMSELGLPAGEAGIEAGEVHLEHPVDLKMGDYSTNVAMVYAKQLGQNLNPVRDNGSLKEPVSNGARELAEKIVEKINLGPRDPSIEKIEVAGAGFINFYLKKDFFVDSVKEVLEQGEKFGSNEKLKGKKIMVEYTDPNPFKEIHIGHLTTNAIGESISRIIGFNGAEIIRANYQGDVGMHVAKAIYGLLELRFDGSKIGDLAQAYAYGAKNFDDKKQEITEINKKIYNRSDEKINRLYDTGREASLRYFEVIYKKLGTKFDEYFFESETANIGKELVEKNIGKVFEESDGAIVFKGENYGLHTRVFINSEGLPTYEAKDLGLIKTKFEKYPDLNLSISVTGNEVKEYFKVMLKAAEMVEPEWARKTKHISHGMLRLPEGKMSSRTGDVISAIGLMSEVEKEIQAKMQKSDNYDKTVEQITLSAVKYSILKSASGKDIIFDFEKSISIEGNSGPYLQYTFARTNSILEKAKSENIPTWTSGVQVEGGVVSEVEKLIYRFPEVVELAGSVNEPHHIATYLSDLAQAFNSYYSGNKIVDASDENSSYKVALAGAVGQVIKNGLYLLGIETPNKM